MIRRNPGSILNSAYDQGYYPSFDPTYAASYYSNLIPPVVASADLTGTITTATAANIVAGGKTIILTLTNDTWVTAGATFNAQRQNIINGLLSAGSEAGGWNATVRPALAVTDVVRTSATVVTITLDAIAAYSISVIETITAAIPGSALTSTNPLTASPSFTITSPNNVSVTLAGTVTGSITETDIVTGGKTITLTLVGDTWIS